LTPQPISAFKTVSACRVSYRVRVSSGLLSSAGLSRFDGALPGTLGAGNGFILASMVTLNWLGFSERFWALLN
jgi:hypothetical protein